MTALAIFGGIVGFVLLMTVSAIFNGYALSVLWGWFVVPTFGAPQLSIVAAIGIAMVVSYLTHQVNSCQKEKKKFSEELAGGVTLALLRPSFALLFGWIVHLFM